MALTPTEIRAAILEEFDLTPYDIDLESQINSGEIHPDILEAWYNPTDENLVKALSITIPDWE